MPGVSNAVVRKGHCCPAEAHVLVGPKGEWVDHVKPGPHGLPQVLGGHRGRASTQSWRVSNAFLQKSQLRPVVKSPDGGAGPDLGLSPLEQTLGSTREDEVHRG